MLGDTPCLPSYVLIRNRQILLQIFDLSSTKQLIPLTPTCRSFHSVILRLLQNRLQRAASLNSHTLYLECNHPSARPTATKLFCPPLGTDGLAAILSEDHDVRHCAGRMARCAALFSRFRPRCTEPVFRVTYRVPGDIQGSRTHPDSAVQTAPRDSLASAAAADDDLETRRVRTTVSVDAHDLFSQLVADVYLGMREAGSPGLLSALNRNNVCNGIIRVRRDWLAKQCETRTWTDGEAIAISRGGTAGLSGAAQEGMYCDPTGDPAILWINTKRQNVGIKFRVLEKHWTANDRLLFTSDEEVAVKYEVELEELLIRTTHLLLELEDAQEQSDNPSGKAIIFTSFRG